MKERLIPYNPCDNCRIPKKREAEMKIILPEKVGAYLKEAEQYGVLPIFYLGADQRSASGRAAGPAVGGSGRGKPHHHDQ